MGTKCQKTSAINIRKKKYKFWLNAYKKKWQKEKENFEKKETDKLAMWINQRENI